MSAHPLLLRDDRASVAANPIDPVYYPLGPPFGAREFAPRGIIPLPGPGAGDVAVLSFFVPIGYDGIILGQFNVFDWAGGGFLEGSGDIAWRVAVNQVVQNPRYLRDCGNILVTLGTIKLWQTIQGGLRIYSGNSVEYVVAAPNAGGSLPAPGTGNVICGLRGWFWPRK